MIQAIVSFFKKATMVIMFAVTMLPLLTSLYNFVKYGVNLIPSFAQYYVNAGLTVLILNVVLRYTGNGG